MFSRRSLNPLQDAGACANEIALLRFIDNTIFETKLGDLGTLLSFSGIDPDCRTDEAVNAFTRRYESAMRLFDDRFRIYSYIVRRSGATANRREYYPTAAATAAVHRRVKALESRAGSLYEIKLYMAVLYEGFRPQKKLLRALQYAAQDVAAQAERALEILGGAVRSFESLLDDLLATRVLHEREARLFLRNLVNYDPAHGAAFHFEPGERLDRTTLDSQIGVYADHLRINDFFVKSISLKQLPGSTVPNLLVDLLEIDLDLIVCIEWKPQSNLHMRRGDSGEANRLRCAIPQSRCARSSWPRRAEVGAAAQNTKSKRIMTIWAPACRRSRIAVTTSAPLHAPRSWCSRLLNSAPKPHTTTTSRNSRRPPIPTSRKMARSTGSGAARRRKDWVFRGASRKTLFHRLMDGQHPLTGEQLIRHRNTELSREGKETTHTLAWDITLSVPKSFSIAATVGGDDRIYRAAEIANREALAALEPYTQARGGGRHLAINTGEAAIATFRHETSRPVDGYAAGQLHFHNVVGNITYDQISNKFRSVQSAEIFKAKSYAMEVFYNSLARQGRELGYRIDFTPGTYAPEIRGISRAYIEHESPRRQQIEAEMEQRGWTGGRAAEIIAVRGREDKLQISPQEQIAAQKEHGKAFASELKVVPDARDRGPVEAPRLLTPEAAVTLAERKLSERHATFEHYELAREALRLSNATVTPRGLNRLSSGSSKPGSSSRSTIIAIMPQAPGIRRAKPSPSNGKRSSVCSPVRTRFGLFRETQT